MLDLMTGPIAAFDGAMSAACTRKATCIEVVETAVFTTLELEFEAEETDQDALTALSYPPLFRLLNVKSFRLASGSILVAFRV